MKHFVALGCCAALLALASGCGKSNNPDALVKEQIGVMNEMADAMDSGAPKEKLDALGERNKDIQKRLDKLNLSESDKKALAEKHKDELNKATERFGKAMMKRAASDMGKMLEGAMPVPK